MLLNEATSIDNEETRRKKVLLDSLDCRNTSKLKTTKAAINEHRKSNNLQQKENSEPTLAMDLL